MLLYSYLSRFSVLLLAASFAFAIKNNIMLFAGLFFILAGIAGFVYSWIWIQ